MLGVARDGIGWLAVWKNGRGWAVMDFWPDYDEATSTFTFEDFELEKLNNIIQIDECAVFVNSYYDNLGGNGDEITRDTLAYALRWQYERGNARVVDVLANCAK